MKISNQILPYEQEIRKNVFQYAYENYNAPPLLDKYVVDQWVGEIYLVSEMKQKLHFDIMEDLEELELLEKIQKDCDHFVIFPDVWSAQNWPMSYQRNQFDTDRRNVVFVNGKIFEMYQEEMTWYWYGHNHKVYFFYKESTSGGIFQVPPGQKASLQVLDLHDMAYVQDKKRFAWWDGIKDMYQINLSREDKIVDETYSGDVLSIRIKSPYLVFDYEKAPEDEHIKPVEITGLYSVGKDQWVQEKQFTIRDQVYVHNRNVLFSNTVLVLLQNGDYWIDNLYSNPKGKYITKIDKHSIQFTKTEEIRQVIVFLRPYDIPDVRIDSTYDEAERENPEAFLLLGKYQKYTNDLYEKLCKIPMTLEQMIEYGYRYDLDVLKAIQRTFPSVVLLRKKDHTRVKQFDKTQIKDDRIFYFPKFEIQVNNRLEQQVMIFINRKLYCFPMGKRQGFDCEYYLLDPELLIPLITGKSITEEQKEDIAFLTQWWEDYVDQVLVVFGNFKSMAKNGLCRHGKIWRKPIAPELFVGNRNGGTEEHLVGGYLFVNGCYSSESTTDTSVFRRIDALPFFTQGDLNFTSTKYTQEGDIFPKAQPQRIIPVYHRVDETAMCMNRIWFQGKKETHTVTKDDGEIKRTKIPLYEDGTVFLDKYGLNCSSEIKVLGSHYYNTDYMYDYLHDPEVNDHIQLHIFPIDPYDELRGYDLRIDMTRVSPINVGSWNDTVMNDVYVKALFIPNEPQRLLAAPCKVKSEEQILQEKVVLRYYLALSKIPTSLTTQYGDELRNLGISWIQSDGTLQNPPSEVRSMVQGLEDFRLIPMMQASDIVSRYLLANQKGYAPDDFSIEPKPYDIEITEGESVHLTNVVKVLQNLEISGGR